MTSLLLKDKQAEAELTASFQLLLDTEIIAFIKYLKVDEKL